jgi:predicted nucleic acid-binding Zn ribbon protein
MGIDQKVKKSKVLVDWAEFVGPRIAQVSEPERLVGDTLYVRVKSDAWRSELALMKRSIIKKMLQRYGEELITDIRFI